MATAKRLSIALLTLIMMVTLAACGGGSNKTANGSADNGKNDGGTNAATNTGANTGSKDDGKIDTSDFETITYVVLGDKPKNGQLDKVMEKVNAIMKEKINAELKFKWVEWADWQTKYNLLLASGEPLDLITIGTDWLDTWGNAQRGAFLPLNNLLEKYAPLTNAEIPAEDWEQSKLNDDIMMIPEDHYTQWVNHGFFYRGDWAKEFGITEPITNFEMLGKYFQVSRITRRVSFLGIRTAETQHSIMALLQRIPIISSFQSRQATQTHSTRSLMMTDTQWIARSLMINLLILLR